MENVYKTIDEKIKILNLQFDLVKAKTVEAELVAAQGTEDMLKIGGAFKILEDLKKDLAEQETNDDG